MTNESSSSVLVGKTRVGDFVHENQTMGTAEGFRNVSQRWLDKTMTFEQGMEQLAISQQETEDISFAARDIKTSLNENGDFVVGLGDRRLIPTQHALFQMGSWANCGRYVLDVLAGNRAEQTGYGSDRQDAQTLCVLLDNGLRRVNPDKQFFFRSRGDTLRAMLTDKYATIDNEWLLKALQTIIPDGRLSHWRGDSDTLFGNILIPDSIRAEDDSDYGGMVSIGNSEIGERALSTMPSIFRAICQNGCIWDKEEGEDIKRVHRGNRIDLDALFLLIKTNLDKQIPLLPAATERLLETKRLKWEGDSIKPLFAQVAIDHKLTKRQATDVFDAFQVERQIGDARTLFGVINSITRAGQAMDNATWVNFDRLGGRLAGMDADSWVSMVTRANNLKAKQVDDVFVTAV